MHARIRDYMQIKFFLNKILFNLFKLQKLWIAKREFFFRISVVNINTGGLLLIKF